MNKPPAWFQLSDGVDFIRLDIIGATDSPSFDLQGKNWLDVIITCKSCTFQGRYSAEILKVDFYRFKQQLILLIYTFEHMATFQDTEGYLQIKINASPNNYFDLKVKACDVPGLGSELHFSMSVESPEIRNLIQQLDQIIQVYPETDYLDK